MPRTTITSLYGTSPVPSPAGGQDLQPGATGRYPEAGIAPEAAAQPVHAGVAPRSAGGVAHAGLIANTARDVAGLMSIFLFYILVAIFG